MPLMRCGENNSGWRFGEHGHCYTGPDAKLKAIKQAFVIYKNNPEEFRKHLSASTNITKSDLVELINDETLSDNEVNILADILDLSILSRGFLKLHREQSKKEN